VETKYPAGIRQVNVGDIDAISEIEKRCFTGPIAYSRSQLAYLALEANSTCLIESQDNMIRGFIMVAYRKDSLTGRIETIDVDPRFQNKGVGMKLLIAAEDDMKHRGMKTAQLEVSERNEPALELYRKAGYKFKEKIKGSIATTMIELTTRFAWSKLFSSLITEKEIGIFQNMHPETIGREPFGVLLIQRGMGLGYEMTIVSFHQNYASYDAFRNYAKRSIGTSITEMNTFLVNLREEKNNLPPTLAFLALQILKSNNKTKE